MKKLLLCLFFLSFFVCSSQNWNVFNRSYRYNYCFNFSSLISNVLFANTTANLGSDTIYNLNLIGTPCIKGCPTLTAAVGSTTLVIPKSRMIVPDQPQFLQRKIKKFSNGMVMLYDTTSMVIIPTCSVGQVWIFDSLNSVNATCSSIITKTIFSITDSVRVIMLSTTDSILLSKQFGLIQFPLAYSKNKYFRLVGIEKRTSYDANALYGQKVPNFWDFYNFGIGDEYYLEGMKCDNMGTPVSSPLAVSVYKQKFKVINKQINTNSITYTLQSTAQSNYLTSQGSCWIFPGPITNTTYVTTYSNSGIMADQSNNMYPGLLCEAYGAGYISPVTYSFGTYNLVSFINDTKGRFTKKAGFYCPYSFNPPITDTFIGLKYYSSIKLLLPSNYYNSTLGGFSPTDKNQKIFTVGLGHVQYEYNVFEHEWHNCLKSAVIGTDTLFGPMPAWGFGAGVEEMKNENSFNVYPNPADNFIKLQNNSGVFRNVEVYDYVGRKLTVNYKESVDLIIDTSLWNDGLYFIRTESDSGLKTYKIIIQHKDSNK